MITNNIDISKYSIDEFFHEYNSLQIPYYQREYRWEKEEISELIEDIINNQGNEYFLGSFIIARKHSDCEVVDGQQRITTLLLIYKALAELNGEINPFENTKYVSMSKTTDRNLADSFCYFAEHSTNQYISNLKVIKKVLAEKDLNYFAKQLKKVVISRISLPSEIDKIAFFAQINSTGQELTNAELIKSYLFAINSTNTEYVRKTLDFVLENIDPKKHDDFYRHFIAYKTGTLENKRGKKIYKSFKIIFDKASFETNFDQLLRFGVAYNFLLHENSILPQFPLIHKSFESYCVLLIEIVLQNTNLINYKINDIYVDKILSAFNFIEGYKFRRILLEMSDKVLTRAIPSMCEQIRHYDDTVDGLINILYINANRDNKAYRMPKRSEIEGAFHKLDMYNKNTHNAYAILEKIERSYGNEIKNLAGFSIEHIMPQNHFYWEREDIGDDESIIHQIGNLTLSTIKDNSEMSNRVFIEKKKLLEERSYLHINREIIKLSNWNHTSIKQRNIDIFSKCMEIWSFNDEKYIIPTKIEIPKIKKVQADNDYYSQVNYLNSKSSHLKVKPKEKQKHEIINKPIRDKEIRLTYNKNAVVLPRVQELLDVYSGQYSKTHAHVAAKELEYILYKNTNAILHIRDYCVQEIILGNPSQRIQKLENLFSEHAELYDNCECQIDKLYTLVDEYENIDLTIKGNLENFCDDLKELPIFRMMNTSMSNGAMTAFMQNMRPR